MAASLHSIQGVGLGLRLPLIDAIKQYETSIDFLEIAPENWINVGGHRAKVLTELANKHPLICHGLSLSLGAPTPLNTQLLKEIKSLLKQYHVSCYSEHLSYCSDQQGYLYDLLPIPFTEEAVYYVADRIKQAQNYLQQTIAIENISYYCAPYQQLSELEFINAILDEAQCELLLDVNNVYVNSINHDYDPKHFIRNLTPSRISYIHIAGHYAEKEDLMIDTHGEKVIEPVWQLLDYTYQQYGVIPTLLERDSNFPPFEQLLAELQTIATLQAKHQEHQHAKVTR